MYTTLVVRKLFLNDSADDGDYDPLPIDRKSCSLLGPTALVVQGLMGILVILSLVYKRHREPKKRPWRIWFFDVSKQALGQAFVHSLNLLISGFGAVHSYEQNACTFYFFNILIDTTLGVIIIYGLLRLTNHILVDRIHLKGFVSGEYGSPPRWTYWIRQAVVYAIVLTSMKAIVVAIIALWPSLIDFGDWLLGWTGSGSFQIVFVMGIFPIAMNIIQFWIIDTIVKASGVISSSPSTPREEAEEPFLSEEGEETETEDLEARAKTGKDIKDNKSIRSGTASPSTSNRVS